MQAGGELGRRLHHRAVVAHIAAAAADALGDDDAVGDVGRAVSLEMPEQGQAAKIDFAADDLGNGAALHLAQRHRLVRTRLIARVQLVRRHAQHARDARSRAEQVGDDGDGNPRDALEFQHGGAGLVASWEEDRCDILIRRHLLSRIVSTSSACAAR